MSLYTVNWFLILKLNKVNMILKSYNHAQSNRNIYPEKIMRIFVHPEDTMTHKHVANLFDRKIEIVNAKKKGRHIGFKKEEHTWGVLKREETCSSRLISQSYCFPFFWCHIVVLLLLPSHLFQRY